ncbi:uncharacterized protein [Dermacentor andersoni]|uniref:uncharacterized protein n=1 Tax=Dermacentor andersoni TaxID=34620 RepID=UPI002416B4AE|nr:uncharacterized protein LOC126542896 [Dermacentor andersoni]
MSPTFPLLVQALAGCFWISAAATFTVDGRCQLASPLTLLDCILGAPFGDPVTSRLPHVDYGYSASSTRTVTSPDYLGPAAFLALKGTPISANTSGHGNTAVAMSPTFPLLVQVGDRKYGFRSDFLCLVVLPCPHTLLCCVSECFSVARLLMARSGDVEENPGPITEEMFNEMIKTQRAVLEKVTDIEKNQASFEARVEGRLLKIEERLEILGEAPTRLANLENNALVKRIDDLENRSRRNNLIIRGIREDVNETEEALRKKVNVDVFHTVLKLKIDSVERIHRLGKRQNGKDRAIILRLSDFRDKTKILRNCFMLRGKDISINEDFSKRIAEIRKQLWNSSSEERKRGIKVKLMFDKMKINDVVYGWNEDTNLRYICKAPSERDDKHGNND